MDKNKTELFIFLAHVTSFSIEEGKGAYTTHRSDVLSSSLVADLTNIVRCSHKEADIYVLLHVAHAVEKGFRKVCVRTTDTDDVVLAIAIFVWIIFDTVPLYTSPQSSYYYGSKSLCYSPYVPRIHGV